MLLSAPLANADAAVIKLLGYLSIPVSEKVIIAELEKHPDYPSLLSISDVLTRIGVKNVAYHLDLTDLKTMSFPLIANKANSEFLVIKKIEDGHATVSDEKWHNKKLSLNELSAIYGGVALSAQSAFLEHAAQTKQTGSSIFKNSVFKLGIILLLLTALIISSGFLYPITWQRDLFMGFKTLGVITSILLLVQSIDSNNPLIQRLCGGGRKTNCNAVLSSKAANIFEGLSWSEVGFFYFAGTWLLALFGGGSALTWKTLAVLNLLSLPYTFYSIYYQAIS